MVGTLKLRSDLPKVTQQARESHAWTQVSEPSPPRSPAGLCGMDLILGCLPGLEA